MAKDSEIHQVFPLLQKVLVREEAVYIKYDYN